MNRLMIPAALLLSAGIAQARPSFSVQGMLGFNGTVESEVGNTSGDEDLASDFGLMGTVEFPISREFRLGGRIAYSAATVDAEAGGDGDISALDGGLWARFVFLPGKFEAFGAGGVGISSITADPETGDSADGTGYHFLAGVGASFPVSRSARIVGGLYYSVHQGELEAGNVTIDTTLSRALLTAGIMF